MKQLSRILVLLITAVFPFIADAQTTQAITGIVLDEASRAPIPGAIIVLINSNNGTSTEKDGTFRLQAVPIGRQSFKISSVGYEDRTINDVVVTAGKEVALNVTLQEGIHNLKEVSVVYNKAKDKTRTNNDMAQVSARSFNVEETKRYAGALGDPSRMAANFAGVVSGNDSRNDIVVKGNSPIGMLWQLEGLSIPNPNHYASIGSTGGPVSMLNNNNIDKSDFLTSAFPAQYGNATAGVFDIRLRNGNKEKPEFVAQMGFNGFELGAEGPIGRNKKTSYMVNYRYSTLGVFQKLGINFGTGKSTPIYQDINYKVVSAVSPKGKLSVFGLAGSSKIDFLGKDVDSTKSELYGGDPYVNELDRNNTIINGVSYEHQISARTSTKLTLGYATTLEQTTADSISHLDASTIPRYTAKYTTAKASAVWMIMHKMDAKNSIQGGINYDNTRFNLLDRELNTGHGDETHVDQSGSFGLLQSYVQWKHRFNNNLSVVTGLHGQYMSLGKATAVEPRASVRYAFNPRQSISVGYGMHHQAQNIYTYFVQTETANGTSYTNKDLGFTRSQHLVATYDWNITSNLRLKAEGYYQSLDKVPVTQAMSSYSALNAGGGFNLSNDDSLVNNGKGHNYGLELTMERFFSKGYYFLATGTVFQSRYEGSDGIERNTVFNTGHVLNVLAGKEFRIGKTGSVFAVDLKLTNVGGRYLTPLDLASSKKEGKAVYFTEKAYSEKQADYFRTDLRLAYRKEYKRSTLELAIDFQNLTNHQNIFGKSYDSKTDKVVTNYQQGFFPVPTLRYTF